MSSAPRKIEDRGKVILTCPACQKEFQIFKCHYRGVTNSCSRKCAAKIKPRKPRTFFTRICKACKKQFQIRKGYGGTGDYCSSKCRSLLATPKGENHPLWKGGTSKRKYSSRKAIKDVIKERGKCEECGVKTNLQGHHIKSHSSHPPGRSDPKNIQVLCKTCHAKKHPRLSKFILSGGLHS
jgi:5-methylcytosine-specific restriction endonuclease McrA